MKYFFAAVLVLLGGLASHCTKPPPPLFSDFRGKNRDAKISFLKSLPGDAAKPFERKENQDWLLKIVQNDGEDIRVRNEALNALTFQESRDLSGAYLELFQDSDFPKELKTNIALELSEKIDQNPQILNLFLKKVNDPEEPDGARVNMALALGDPSLKTDPKIIKALVKAYENPSNHLSLRINAITGLARYKDQEAARKTLEKSLHDPEAKLRLALAEFFTHSGRKDFLPWLRVLAQDADPAIASQAQKGVSALE